MPTIACGGAELVIVGGTWSVNVSVAPGARVFHADCVPPYGVPYDAVPSKVPSGAVTGTVTVEVELLVTVTTPFVSESLILPELKALAQLDCRRSVDASVASVTCSSGVVVQLLYCDNMELMRLKIV